MDLAEQIKNYYFEHLDELSDDKRFHYATRLAAWLGEPRAFELLRDLKKFALPGNDLEKTMIQLLGQEPHDGINNISQRRPFFDEFKGLYGIHLALFRVRHLKEVYGIDASEVLFKLVGRQHLDELAHALISDRQAMKILSTYAINYLYLYKGFLIGDEDFIDLGYITSLKEDYDLDDPAHIQLLIYLYTHCIIGASNFYVRPIGAPRLEAYRNMLAILEPLISDKFHQINLDNKLEFLVCARICGYRTDLFERVQEECRISLSPNGTFLQDIHNLNPQKNRVSLDKSEHRNVLYIMSRSPYRPHSILLQD